MAYANENLRRVKEDIARRRILAMDLAEQNRRHLHTISPEAREIDAALAQTAMQLFGVACMPSGDEKAAKMEQIRAENLALQEARVTLLEHLGLGVNRSAALGLGLSPAGSSSQSGSRLLNPLKAAS